MRTCAKCGSKLTPDAAKCPACGQAAPPAAEPVMAIIAPPPAPKTAAPAEPDLTELEEPPLPAGLAWLNRHWIWPAAVILLAVLGLGIWGIQHNLNPPKRVEVDTRVISPAVKKQMAQAVQEYLPEKLEWGRDLLKKRLPNRFPEELLLAADETKAEAGFTNPEQTAATYSLQVAYHFTETPKKTYIWVRATFFFERRGGAWAIVGEKWPNEWDVHFE